MRNITKMMKAWKVGRVLGIQVYIHWSFLILLVWVAAISAMTGHHWRAVVWSLVFVITIFAIVVVHELAHALMARRFGIRTRGITLLPIGGVSALEKIPEQPRQELLMAAAGPAVNIALALILLAGLVSESETLSPSVVSTPVGNFLGQLFWINVGLATFNLLPAFPMDGGRVFRALLAMRMDYVRATDQAAAMGRVFAGLFGLLGFLFNPFLILIAIFVWSGAAHEAAMVRTRFCLENAVVRDVMVTQFRRLSAADTLGVAAEYLRTGFQREFPVVERGTLVGMLSDSDLIKALASRSPSLSVNITMRKQFETVEPDRPPREVATLLQHEHGYMPVVSEGTVVGLLTPEGLARTIEAKTAERMRTRRLTVGTDGYSESGALSARA
jgi:Zn-dependent protease/CBS domain-containing protein